MILWGGIRMLWTRPEYFNSDSSSRTFRFLMAMSHLKLPASSGSPKYQTHMCHTEMQRKVHSAVEDFRFRLKEMAKLFRALFLFSSNHNNQFLTPVSLTRKRIKVAWLTQVPDPHMPYWNAKKVHSALYNLTIFLLYVKIHDWTGKGNRFGTYTVPLQFGTFSYKVLTADEN